MSYSCTSCVPSGLARSLDQRRRLGMAVYMQRYTEPKSSIALCGRTASYMLSLMTLIISVLTEQYVALVSDRRTTWSIDRKITRQEDTDTKTFKLFGQFLMGFTGLARIDGWRIERWMMEILNGVPREEYFSTLARESDAAFQRLGIADTQAHAFLGVGYASDRPGGRVLPLCVTISNSLDRNDLFS